MHLSGLLGMPRRVYTYLPGLGWDVYNFISTIGSFILAVGVLLFAINVLAALVRRERAPTTRGAPAGWNGRRRRHPSRTTSQRCPS